MKPRRVAISLRCSSFIAFPPPSALSSRCIQHRATSALRLPLLISPQTSSGYRSLRSQRRDQRVEPEFEYGVVVSGGLERAHERLIGPFVVPQRGILLLVFGTPNRRELHHRGRDDVNLYRPQDKCGVGPGDAHL